MRLVDIWASCKWHRILGCDGHPRMEWLSGEDERMIRLIVRPMTRLEALEAKAAGVRHRTVTELHTGERVPPGAELVTVETSTPSSTSACLPFSRLCELTVDNALHRIGSTVLHALLMHRYPSTGPYARSEAMCDYRAFRFDLARINDGEPHLGGAAALSQMTGALGSAHLERITDKMLGQMERDFLEEVGR